MWELVLALAAAVAIAVLVYRGLRAPVGARVDVEFEEGARRFDWVVLRNDGDRRAEQVYLTLEASGEANPVKTSTRQKLPTTLEPGGVQRLQAATHDGSRPPYQATVTWLDDGEQKERRKTIGRG